MTLTDRTKHQYRTMKPLAHLLTLAFLASSSVIHAEGGSEKKSPAYLSEAPLPEGWPEPGPYNEVSEKSFPSYRAAYTPMQGENFAFWRLFNHIKRNNIPMTSPVEMDVEAGEESLSMKSMGFLYQNPSVGTAGKDTTKVEVKDIPAMKALSYSWLGSKSAANLSKAKAALDAELTSRKLEVSDYRVMGYNSPRVPDEKKTWEMIAVLPTSKTQAK